MTIPEKMFAIVTSVFKRHGGRALDTPIFELKEVFTGKTRSNALRNAFRYSLE
jgi:histidyl-tRNA synthetase